MAGASGLAVWKSGNTRAGGAKTTRIGSGTGARDPFSAAEFEARWKAAAAPSTNYGAFVLFSALSVRGINAGTAHFGFEGRNKEHQGPRLAISTPMGPRVKYT